MGLGLWNSIPGTLLAEGSIFVAGVALYLGSTRARDRAGKYGAWSLIGLLVLLYAGQFSGTVPPDETVVAYGGLSQWIFVFFGFWVDRHRQPMAG